MGGVRSVDRGGGKRCVVRAARGRAAWGRCRRVARADRQLPAGLPVPQGRLAAAQGYRYHTFYYLKERMCGVWMFRGASTLS